MLKQTIVWTALPHGIGGAPDPGATVRLSAFAAPRLWNDDGTPLMKLAQFPDFLDWPDVIRGSTYKVEFGGGPTLDATVTSAAPDSALWKALFTTETDVIPFAFEDLSGAQILTFSAVDIHDTLIGIYQEVATNPGYHGGSKLPDTDDLSTDPGLDEIRRPVEPEPPWVPADRPTDVPVRPPERPPTQPQPSGCLGCLPALILAPLLAIWGLIRRVLKWLGLPIALAMFPLLGFGGGGIRLSPGGGSGGAGSKKKQALDDLRAFLAPTTQTPEPLPTAAEVEATFDFHKMIAALGDYPELLRRMGLVVDLEVTVPAGGLPASGTIRIEPAAPLTMASTNYTPKTRYDLAADLFVASPRTPGADIANGLLRLQDAARFAVHQVDVASSGIKLQNAATNIVGLKVLEEQPVNGPEEQGLPALQTAGIAVVRPDVRSRLVELFRWMHAINHGLTKKDGSLHLALASGEPELPATDELFAEDVARGVRLDIRDSKAKGWLSLCQRVGSYAFLDAGTTISIEDEGFVQSGVTEPVKPTATRVLRAHETLFTWDGWSLAAPRPGHAILPDTEPPDPNNPDPDNPDGKTKTGAVPNTAATSFRLETAFEAKDGTLPRLRYGNTYRVRARLVDLAGNSVFGPEDPAFDQTQPEVTGEFVFRRFEPVGPPPVLLKAPPKEGESLELLTVRSAAFDSDPSIRAQATERHLAPPKSSQLLAERHGQFDAGPVMASDAATYNRAALEAGSPTHELDLATNKRTPVPGVKQQPGNELIWFQENDTFVLRYLPDPFARGVLLRDLPGMTGPDDVQDNVNRLPFDGTWPDLKPVRLRLTGLPMNETPPAPSWDPATRVLTVGLAQGETRTVLIASYFDQADLEQMGIWDWTVQMAPPNIDDLRTAAVEGRNWLHLPYRTLTLVHPVQQPLTIPTIASFDPAVRTIGDTSALVNATLDIDAKSTGKLDVWATWSDRIDNPDDPANDPAADLVQQQMHVRELAVADGANDAPTIKQVLDGMAKGTPKTPANPNPPAPPPSPGLRHAFGDTKYHKVTYSLVGTTRFREHFPPAIADDPTKLVRPFEGEDPKPWPSADLDIPNSARPVPLRPVSILPTFHWSESTAGAVRTRARRGGGLRVYVERPWFLSGNGEEIGVVLKLATAPLAGKEAETLQKYTSEWAMDPLWNAARTQPLKVGDFKNGTPSPAAEPRLLAELSDPRVHVVGFVPEYDAVRKLWFADIQLEPANRYFPFVRLALARYHPISLDGAHLSSIVLSDYVQVAPHRWVDYDLGNVNPNGQLQVTLRGPGHGQADGPVHGGTVVVARLERREHGDTLADEPLGWVPVDVILLERVKAANHQVTWQGAFDLPGSLPSPLRVSVLEAQALRSDGGELTDLLAFLSQHEGQPAGAATLAGPSMVEIAPFGYRVVFADATIALL